MRNGLPAVSFLFMNKIVQILRLLPKDAENVKGELPIITYVLLHTDRNIMHKILFVVTSCGHFEKVDRATGVWLEEYAVPFMLWREAGFIMTVATPEGGQAPVDPISMPDRGYCTNRFTNMLDQYQTELDEAQAKLQQTEKLSDMSVDDFDAIYYPGGHGCLWDVTVDKTSLDLLHAFIEKGKMIMAICHGSGVLAQIQTPNGPWVKGQAVTGFSNEEEKLVGLENDVPYSVENILIEAGADYSCKEPGVSYVIEDEQLITGQNAVSAYGLASVAMKKMLKQL